ncbi:tRNA (adenosine(37)-N6)-dimethylallyltransferase MiaA [candidate division KSB1 bacterium]|nr:tRNA (adenosine(37)-N6)-dimethylallyltransferase MiaA [candidate division KSB1 bacterium]
MNWSDVLRNARVLLLVGPTAVGKTGLSLEIAQTLGGEIVSADSRQIYRYMDIGTAKPTFDERAVVPHHFIDTKDPDELYSAGEYGRDARAVIQDLLQKDIVPVVVGGSGFYIRALVDGLFAPEISDHEVKEKWRRRLVTKGREAVFAELERVDPRTAERLHINDTQRIVRALEVYELTGKPISQFQEGQEEPADFEPVFIGLERDRSELVQRIEQRVDLMMDQGLMQEVQALLEKGFSPDVNALATVGYQEVVAYLQGEYDFEEMVEQIKIHTRQYSKRQMTWFRRDLRVNWLNLTGMAREEQIQAVFQIW